MLVLKIKILDIPYISIHMNIQYKSIYISREPSLKKAGGDPHCSKFNKFNKIDQKRVRVHRRAQNFKEKAIRCETKNP